MPKPFDVHSIRKDFPILNRRIHQQPLIYFDNAATTQKPRSVIERIQQYYSAENANVHRAFHKLGDEATVQFEHARVQLQQFIGAADSKEIIWTKGTTESINLVAQSYARQILKPGDKILISEMEHHSNIVPWQVVCQMTGAQLTVLPITPQGKLQLDQLEHYLNDQVRLVSIAHASNALGSINDIKTIIQKAHAVGAVCMIDGAQAPLHLEIDVQALDCDFYAFSGHKMLGPTGIGVLYAKEKLLNAMCPYQTGGEMIQQVTMQHTTYNELPYKFEAGTPNIAGAIGISAAIDYLNQLDQAAAHQHETVLLQHATDLLSQRQDRLQAIGTAEQKIPILSFLIKKGGHPSDLGTLLDQQGIAIRAGHHCAMPLMAHLNIPGTARISLSFYNTKDEIDRCFQAIDKALKVLS